MVSGCRAAIIIAAAAIFDIHIDINAVMITVSEMSKSRLLRENLPLTMQGVGVVVPLFAGLDTSVSPARPLIFFYDPLGAQFQAVGYAASGSGSGSIRSIVSYTEKYGQPRPSEMTLGQAVQFTLRLLMTASEFDAATGGINPETNTFATIKVLDAEGVRTISAEEQAKFLRA